MRSLACALALLALACGDDGGGGDSSSSSSSEGGETTTTTETGMTMSSTTAPADTGGAACTDCWLEARNGACSMEFNACAMSPDCAGSLFCIDSMCTPDGITSECTQLCCMNCMEHMICGVVDTWLACMQSQCGDVCMPNDCSP